MTRPRDLPGPRSLPECEHGVTIHLRCQQCIDRDRTAREAVKPLVDLYWENRGRNAGDLDHLLFRAYRLGMKHKAP